MEPVGPLMKEHRLIERMISLMAGELERLDRGRPVHRGFHEHALDFIRTYADRCHHGKEEDILFQRLEAKPLSEEHRTRLQELVRDHARAREITRDWALALDQKPEIADTDAVARPLRALVELYPGHIEKEDRHFFLPVMRYFSPEEKENLLVAEAEFDRAMIHETYRRQVERYEAETILDPLNPGPAQRRPTCMTRSTQQGRVRPDGVHECSCAPFG